jgi:pimeloyl-ACP methyl ester carboxylesterase
MLFKGYTVIAPDMLGHGFSSCPDKVGAYTFTKLFKDVITIFDAYIPDDAKVGF